MAERCGWEAHLSQESSGAPDEDVKRSKMICRSKDTKSDTGAIVFVDMRGLAAVLTGLLGVAVTSLPDATVAELLDEGEAE